MHCRDWPSAQIWLSLQWPVKNADSRVRPSAFPHLLFKAPATCQCAAGPGTSVPPRNTHWVLSGTYINPPPPG